MYRGGGKDLLDVNRYKSITLNSVISKVLELYFLEWLNPLLVESGIPHPNQSAYQKGVSCMDATFSTQEVINCYLQEGSLYDIVPLRPPEGI